LQALLAGATLAVESDGKDRANGINGINGIEYDRVRSRER
jgi:hypothetical protein